MPEGEGEYPVNGAYALVERPMPPSMNECHRGVMLGTERRRK
jgi:hypothetical protein